MYDNLAMPWSVAPSTAFPQQGFCKAEWDRDGVLTGADFFGGEPEETTLEQLELGLATASMVTRWRDAHPDLVGTDEDCVKRLIADLRPLLGGRGLKCCGSTAILLFTRAGEPVS
jgi:trans-aconitate 3-methyltransferase